MGQDSTTTIVPISEEIREKIRKRDSRPQPRAIVPMSEVHCPAGHTMQVPAEFAADGRAFFCKQCDSVFSPGTKTVGIAVDEIAIGLPRDKLRLPRWKDLKKFLARKKQGKDAPKTEPEPFDAKAHAELAKAFPNVAAKLKPLLTTEVEVECPGGHSLIVPRELVEAGKQFFCPSCRGVFRPGGEPEEAVEATATPAPGPKPITAPAATSTEAVANPGSEGLVQIAKGCGLIARASLIRVRRLFSGSGSWIGSCILHALLLMLAALIGFGMKAPQEKPYTPMLTDVTPEEQQRLLDELKKRDVFRKVTEKNVSEENLERYIEMPVTVPESRMEERVEMIRDVDEPKVPESALGTDMPLSVPTGSMGFGDGPPATTGRFAPGVTNGLGSGIYALRSDARTRLKAAKRFGGGEDTESAVELALAWLAKRQKADGSWDFRDKQQVALTGRGSGKYNLGATGLATLAYLGAGYSHKHGKHKEVVGKALDWLIYNQEKYGGWTKKPENQEMHAQGIATLALVEGYAAHPSGKDGKKLLKRAQLGVKFIQRAQYPYSGWAYYMPQHTHMHWTKMVEQSVVIWNGMALKGARTSGVRVDGKSLAGMVKWLDDAQGKKGQYAYSGVARSGSPAFCRLKRSTPCMVAAALMMRMWTGCRPGYQGTHDSADIVLKHLESHYPRWRSQVADPGPEPERPGPRPKDRKQVAEWNEKCAIWLKWHRAKSAVRFPDMYFLHHGTIAMFQVGGERWKKWNAKMTDVVLKHQQKDGSWAAGGTYVLGSQVMSTSLGALILESYYRYSPLYSRDGDR